MAKIGPCQSTEHIQAWRRARGNSVTALAKKSGVSLTDIEAIEAGEIDPPVSVLEALAAGLSIPPGWLYSTPTAVKRVLEDPDEENDDWLKVDSPDPLLERMIWANQDQRELFALLTALLQSGEAQTSSRSRSQPPELGQTSQDSHSTLAKAHTRPFRTTKRLIFLFSTLLFYFFQTISPWLINSGFLK